MITTSNINTPIDGDEDLTRRLMAYFNGAPRSVAELREDTEVGVFPYPDDANPAFEMIVRQGYQMGADNLMSTILWVAAHAWFEGALAGTGRGDDSPAPIDRAAVLRIMSGMGVTEVTAKKYVRQIAQHDRSEYQRLIEGAPLADDDTDDDDTDAS